MQMNAIIIDDEPLAHEIINDYLMSCSFIKLVGQCYLATDALNIMTTKRVDLIFLDMKMPKLSGLDFLSILDNPPQIIVTSAHKEYALLSYDFNVCDYLLKPIRQDRFLKAITRAFENFKAQSIDKSFRPENTPKRSIEKDNEISIKVERQVITIKTKDIIYAEAFGNYIKVWTTGKCFMTIKTLKSFEDKLKPIGFIRVHKSYIVNPSHIIVIGNHQLETTNGYCIPVGKNYKSVAKKLMANRVPQ